MPRAGVSARPARPWWEELEREAFADFPAARQVRRTPRTASAAGSPAAVGSPARSPSAARSPARTTTSTTRPVRAPGRAPAGVAPSPRRPASDPGPNVERNQPATRPPLPRHERPDFRPDRVMLWAVVLGLFLILVAVASAHL